MDPGQPGRRRRQYPEQELRRQPRPCPRAVRPVPRAAEGQELSQCRNRNSLFQLFKLSPV